VTEWSLVEPLDMKGEVVKAKMEARGQDDTVKETLLSTADTFTLTRCEFNH
jgi:hypothetical protein